MKNKLFFPWLFALQMFLAQGVMAQHTQSSSLLHENMTASNTIEMKKTAMLDNINNYRDSLQLHKLKNDSQLTTVAQQYAETIDHTQHFDHQDQHGHWPMKRISLLFPNHDFVVVGENLSALDDVQATLKSRKASPAHNGSLIRANCSHIGIWYYHWYRVVLVSIKR